MALSDQVRLALFFQIAIFAVQQATCIGQSVVPFTVNVSDADILDLQHRLNNSRIGQTALQGVPDFTYGMNVPTLMKFKNYWLNKYNWRKHEAVINRYPQFTTQIQGLNIHFIHAKPPPSYRTVIPLVIIHGWPGNVYDFHKLIPILTDPNKHLNLSHPTDVAYEVIAPSIPGYGWSEQPSKAGFNTLVAAQIFNTLMVHRLNFTKYVASGGDWGFVVAGDIARLFPEKLLGLYLWSICHLPFIIEPSNGPTNGSAIAFSATEEEKEAGYFLEHATKPDTVGIGLNDSPIGIMSYMLEKFSTWTSYANIYLPDGGLTATFSMDELLTSISIYWFNQNVVSSIRFYKEWYENLANQNLSSVFVNVPTAYGASPNDIGHCQRVSESVAAAAYNMCQYTAFPSGGHFAALENPQQLAGDMLNFSAKIVNNQC